MLTNITEEDILFCECLYNSLCLSESLFSNFDSLSTFIPGKLGHIRLGQTLLISHEYIIDDQQPDLDEKENMALLCNVGDSYILGGRNFGKSLGQKLDMLISFTLHDTWPMALTSYDFLHIRGIMEPVISSLSDHEIVKEFCKSVKRSPNYLLTGANGCVIEGINMNIFSKNSGNQFFQKHLKKMWIEEACVDGHTKVRYLENNKIKTNNISRLINSKKYKNIKVLSYNFKSKKIEFKKISKIFKKQVKDYEYYKIYLNKKQGKHNLVLKVSQKQKIYVNDKYSFPSDIKQGDYLYLLDHCKLSSEQKEVLIGCLLGDAHLEGNSVCFTHGKKQKNYLEYKKKIFNNLFSIFRKTKNQSNHIKQTKESKNKHNNGIVVKSKSKETNCLEEFRNFKFNKKDMRFIEVNKDLLEKYFTVKSLAFWYMDDGNVRIYKRKKTNTVAERIALHTEGFSYKTNCYLKEFLKRKFDLDCSVVGKKYYRLLFTTNSSKKFLNIVQDYVHKDLYYKIKYRKNNFIDLSDDKYNLFPVSVLKIEKVFNSSWTMYDFQVEDNHNFFANGLLVSNSFETDEVYNNRRDSRHEQGCIERASGMTNFSKHSPCGRIFYDYGLKPSVVNIPQYINPFWDDKERERAIKKFSGEQSPSFRIFVKGEVVEDGVSVFDMQRIRPFYVTDRTLKAIEVSKKNFDFYTNILSVLERPNNASCLYICADIGEAAPTEIAILAEVNKKYKLLYNVTLYNLTDKEQYSVFKFLVLKLKANIVAIDTTEGTGRSIYRSLEEQFGKENLVWVSHNEKISVDFARDDKNNLVYEKGKPVYVEEYISEWSIKHLKDLLYDGRIEIPEDAFKFDSQINNVKVFLSGTRNLYECMADEDHFLQSMQSFSIAQWMHEFNIIRPAMIKMFAKSFV